MREAFPLFGCCIPSRRSVSRECAICLIYFFSFISLYRWHVRTVVKRSHNQFGTKEGPGARAFKAPRWASAITLRVTTSTFSFFLDTFIFLLFVLLSRDRPAPFFSSPSSRRWSFIFSSSYCRLLECGRSVRCQPSFSTFAAPNPKGHPLELSMDSEGRNGVDQVAQNIPWRC